MQKSIQPLVVSVNAKDEVFLGETKYDLPELTAKLKAVYAEKPDQRVFIRGDKLRELFEEEASLGGWLRSLAADERRDL